MTDTESTDHKGLLEAALFMSPEPLSTESLSKITGIHSLGYLKDMLLKVREDFTGRGFHLVEGNEGWQFQVDNRFLHKVASLTPYSDLPEGEKRCLALVAYKEPVLQSDVIKIQGNKAYAYIKHLIKKGLIKSEREGRTKSLSLTQEFERYFGEDKERIRDQLIEKLNRKEKEV